MLTFNVVQFERAAQMMGAAIDQVPFALANAMTTAAFKARDNLIQDMWPRYVEVRGPQLPPGCSAR
jgi:hypothetical protein